MKYFIFTLLLLIFVSPGVQGQNYVFTTSFPVQGNKTIVIELVTTGIQINQQNQNGYNFVVEYDYSIKSYNKNGKENSYSFSTMQGYFDCDGREAFFSLPNSTGSGSGVLSGNMWSTFPDPNNATVAELMCNTIKFQIEGAGYNGEQFVYSTGTSTLPIELITFDAYKKDRQVEIAWKTASELNNDYFTIERSVDGMFWENLQTVQGAGNSSQVNEYSWLDNSPYAGISYYRLKQTDYDGTTEMFHIVSVEQDEVEELQVYPYPTAGISTLTGVDDSQELRLFNSMGSEVTGRVSISSIGGNFNLDMSQLPKEMYYLSSGEQSLRLVKQ